MPRLQGIDLRAQTAGVIENTRVSPQALGADQSGLRELAQGTAQLGNVVFDREQQSEITTVSARMAQAQAEFTTRLRERADKADLSSPNGVNITEELMKEYDAFKDQMADGLQTSGAQNYFERSSGQLRSHLLAQGAAEQADLAGAKAKNDYVTGLNSRSSALLNDPSSFEFAVAQNQEALQAAVQSGGMPAKVAYELNTRSRSELAKSAVRGWIQANPEEAKSQLKGGRWDQYFDADAKKQLFGEAQQALIATEVEAQRREAAARRALDTQQRVTQNNFLVKMQEGSLSTKEILNSNLDAFGSGSKEQFLNMMKAESQQRVTRTNGDLMTSLFARVHLPEGDPNKITDENDLNQYYGRGLSMDSLNQLRSEVQGRKTEAGKIEADMKQGVLNIAKGQLTRSNPLTGMRDPIGDEQYQKFMSYYLTEFKEQRKAGKSVKALTDPDSPDYLGKAIRTFTRTPDQIMSDIAGGMRRQAPAPKASPRKDGESAADYLNRIGK